MSRAKTILVVDADRAVREALCALLEAEGFRVESAADGDAALAKVQAAPPDVLVLDIQLPGRNGYQVCRALRDDPATAALPVLFASAKSQPSDRYWAKRVGADAFCAKPCDPAAFVAAVHELAAQSDVTMP